MADPREEREKLEELLVGPLGVRARDSAGRAVREEESSLRTCFQRDADRITQMIAAITPVKTIFVISALLFLPPAVVLLMVIPPSGHLTLDAMEYMLHLAI